MITETTDLAALGPEALVQTFETKLGDIWANGLLAATLDAPEYARLRAELLRRLGAEPDRVSSSGV